MKIHKIVTYVASCLTLLLSAVAVAAPQDTVQIKQLDGTVLINQGKGFFAAQPGMNLYSGNRVLVMTNSSARVVFSDACVVDMAANSLFTFQGVTDCGKLQKQVQIIGPYYAAAIGVEAIGPNSPDKTRSDAPEVESASTTADAEVVFAGMSMNEVIVVGVGVGAGLGIIVASGDNGKKSNGAISPE